MSGTSLKLTIEADETDLRTHLALANAAVREHAAEVKKMAAAANAASADMKGSLLPALAAQAAAEIKARQEVAALKREMAEGGEEKQGLLAVFDALKGRFASITNMTGEIKEFGEAFIAAFAVEKIAETINELTEFGSKIDHLSKQLGEPAEAVSKLAFAAKSMGTDADAAAAMVEHLDHSAVEAAGGTGTAAKAFADLHVKVTGANGQLKSSGALMADVADAFSRAADGPAKTAIAIALAGRTGADWIPLLDQGRVGLDDMGAAAERAGVVLSGPMAEGMEATSGATSEMEQSFKGVALTLYGAFKPAIDATIGGITELTEGFNDWIKGVSVGHDVLTALVVVFDGIVFAVETCSLVLKEIYLVAVASWTGMMDVASQLGVVMEDVFSGRWGQIGHDFKQAQLNMEADQEAVQVRMLNAATEYATSIKALYSNIGANGVDTTGGAAGPEVAKPKLNASNLEDGAGKKKKDNSEAEFQKAVDDEIIALEQEKAATTIALSRMALDAKKQNLEAALAAGQITKQQEIAGEQALVDQEYDLDLKALDDQLANGNLTVVERQKVNDKILILQAKFAADMAKISHDMATANAADATKMAKDWQTVLQPVGKAFEDMFEGILEKHQTFAQAFGRVELQMFNNVIGLVEKSIVKWAAGELAKTGATITGNTIRTTSTAAAAATGKAIEASAGSASVIGNAYKAASAAYYSQAGIPIYGPLLGAAAAAATFAGVIAFDVFSAEGGFGNVPYDGAMTELHKNEMVLPASIANTFRNMAASSIPSANTNTFGGGSATAATAGDVHHHFSPTIHMHGANGNAPTTDDMIRELRNAHRNGRFRTAQR